MPSLEGAPAAETLALPSAQAPLETVTQLSPVSQLESPENPGDPHHNSAIEAGLLPTLSQAAPRFSQTTRAAASLGPSAPPSQPLDRPPNHASRLSATIGESVIPQADAPPSPSGLQPPTSFEGQTKTPDLSRFNAQMAAAAEKTPLPAASDAPSLLSNPVSGRSQAVITPLPATPPIQPQTGTLKGMVHRAMASPLADTIPLPASAGAPAVKTPQAQAANASSPAPSQNPQTASSWVTPARSNLQAAASTELDRPAAIAAEMSTVPANTAISSPASPLTPWAPILEKPASPRVDLATAGQPPLLSPTGGGQAIHWVQPVLSATVPAAEASSEAPRPTVNVSIGRIQVRAIQPPRPTRPRAPRTLPSVTSLNTYLHQGGQR
ncbi:MAG: hypothetical protein AAF766_22285 [Cyanobacteria bacterium P01_D01_bin.14]